MDVILHIGAHRCATTTFQHYLRRNSPYLADRGIRSWGPRKTRTGLFRGIIPAPGEATGRNLERRARGRISLNLSTEEARGTQKLVVSDENMTGTVRENLRLGELYAGVGERMARYHAAFGGCVSDVFLSIRSLELFWASALGFGLTRGRPVPRRAALEKLANGPRSWRDVVTDIACATPGARLHVLAFENFAGRPDAQLEAMTGTPGPRHNAHRWLNATPALPALREIVGTGLPEGEGRWQPFEAEQRSAMRETYRDDLFWLADGADGLARLAKGPEPKSEPTRAGSNPPEHDLTRGSLNDRDERPMAQAR